MLKKLIIYPIIIAIIAASCATGFGLLFGLSAAITAATVSAGTSLGIIITAETLNNDLRKPLIELINAYLLQINKNNSEIASMRAEINKLIVEKNATLAALTNEKDREALLEKNNLSNQKIISRNLDKIASLEKENRALQEKIIELEDVRAEHEEANTEPRQILRR
jgi:hypothetical protein